MKNEIRNKMRAMRRTLTSEQIAHSSQKITQEILNSDVYKTAKNVCLYLSAYKEVDTSALLNACKADNKTVALPVTDEDGIITLYIDNGEYKTGNFGITEPAGNKTISPKEIDLFIIPALAFDKQGGRLGFGKGCYDRLLKDTTGYKIGIGYAFQLVDKVPSDKHDIKMDMVICL